MLRGVFIGGLVGAALILAAPAMAQAPKFRFHFQQRAMAGPKPAFRTTTATVGMRFLTLVPEAKLLKVIRLSDRRFLIVFRRANRVERVVLAH